MTKNQKNKLKKEDYILLILTIISTFPINVFGLASIISLEQFSSIIWVRYIAIIAIYVLATTIFATFVAKLAQSNKFNPKILLIVTCILVILGIILILYIGKLNETSFYRHSHQLKYVTNKFVATIPYLLTFSIMCELAKRKKLSLNFLVLIGTIICIISFIGCTTFSTWVNDKYDPNTWHNWQKQYKNPNKNIKLELQ